jgi:hypothetical protein
MPELLQESTPPTAATPKNVARDRLRSPAVEFVVCDGVERAARVVCDRVLGVRDGTVGEREGTRSMDRQRFAVWS